MFLELNTNQLPAVIYTLRKLHNYIIENTSIIVKIINNYQGKACYTCVDILYILGKLKTNCKIYCKNYNKPDDTLAICLKFCLLLYYFIIFFNNIIVLIF